MNGVSQLSDLEDDKDDQAVVDPDDIDVDLERHHSEVDEDIDSEEAFGEGDEDRFKTFTFRGSNRPIERRKERMGRNNDVDKGNGLVEHREGEEDVGSNTNDDEGDTTSQSQDHDNFSEEDKIDNGVHGYQSPASSSDDSENEQESEGDGYRDSKSSNLNTLSESRAAVRALMASEQKAVTATISAATKSDAQKGKAITQQRQTFSSLLNVRIRLQKALVSSNTQSAASRAPQSSLQSATPSSSDALQAALALWNHLDTLRTSLSPASKPQKRSLTSTISTPPSTLWTAMTAHETSSVPFRRAILSKWSNRTNPASAIPSRNGSSTKPATSILSVLDAQLQGLGMEKLVRTSTETSARDEDAEKNSDIDLDHDLGQRKKRKLNFTYDDTPFYTLLLRDLVDQKASFASSFLNLSQTTTTPPSILIPKLPKQHRKVDPKASKGRKLSYAVHEKLQNFAVAENGNGEWGEKRVEEFFGGLLGVRYRGKGLREEEEEGSEEDDGDGEEDETEGIRLFGTGR